MSSAESSDVGTPIYDQLAAEVWPPEPVESPQEPQDDPVIATQA